MTRYGLTVLAATALAPSLALAQQQATVTGTVTSDAGAPLPSVQVFVQALNIGTMTGADGRYTLTVPGARATGAVRMVARRIGYQQDSATVTLAPGASVTQNFTLAASATQLTEVVVTALGLEREKSQLGTAVQQLSAEELNQTRPQSVVNQLQGKVSGVQITGSGTQGGSQRVVIRGANSLTGNNQPLFIIDGFAISNTGRGGSANSGYDYGSAINDLNPDDIESMTVLKGPNAAALYGSRAANGAIVITTKRGAQGRTSVEINTTYTFDRPSVLPELQNSYGQGAQGEFRYVNGAGAGRFDNSDQSWGPRFEGQLIDQFTGPQQPWVARPDNVEDFFETGGTLSGTVAVSGGTERVSARLSLGGDNVNGYVPANSFQKRSALLSGRVQVTDRLSTDATLNYVRSTGMNRPGVGYTGGILSQFIWFGRQVDVNALRNYARGSSENNGPAGREYNWNYNYHNNPFWLQNENPTRDVRDRFIGNVAVNYQITDWLTGTARTGSDIYRYDIDRKYAPGAIGFTNSAYAGAFTFIDDYSNVNTAELLLQADREIRPGLQVQALLGGNQQRTRFNTSSVATEGISTPGIYNVANAAIAPTLGQNDERRQINAVFGSLAVTWNNWLTVEGTARNDWSSTLPEGENSFFYPSLSTSIVLTDAIPALQDNSVLTYAKIRGSVAEVGSDAPAYALATTFSGIANQFAGLPQFTLGDVVANESLRPEITRASEVGLELGFFGGRATFDATYYTKRTTDQIINVAVAPTTGYTSKSINAGEMRNEGFEALLSVTPVDLPNGFRWTTAFNYSHNRSRVTDIFPGIDAINLGSSWSTFIQARKGEAYGAIYGNAFARDEATGKIITRNGLTVQNPTPQVLGNIQPDWTGGWSNSFNYGNFTLNALLDIRVGGDIVSVTNFFSDYAGVSAASLRGREIAWDAPGIVVDGIDAVTGQPNTVNVTSEDYFQNIFPVMEPYIYDGGWLKLREVRLGYDLPAELANRLYAQRMNVAFIGRNLWTRKNVPGIDPEFSYSTGNFQGIEFAALPNTRSIGFSVSVTP